MGLEDKLPSGLLLTTVEKMGGYARKNSVPPASSSLACCAVELFQASGPGTTWPDSAWNRHRLPHGRPT